MDIAFKYKPNIFIVAVSLIAGARILIVLEYMQSLFDSTISRYSKVCIAMVFEMLCR